MHKNFALGVEVGAYLPVLGKVEDGGMDLGIEGGTQSIHGLLRFTPVTGDRPTYHRKMIEDLQTLEYKLTKRGFRRDDLLLHQCEKCKEQAVASYIIAGKSGGRDIKLCLACGDSRSWRSVPGLEKREEDIGFDLRTFLG
jgi:hypothetical protein